MLPQPELRKRFWGQHMWARGYFCATVGAVDEPTIKACIENRKWDEDDQGFKITAPTEPLSWLAAGTPSDGFSSTRDFQSAKSYLSGSACTPVFLPMVTRLLIALKPPVAHHPPLNACCLTKAVRSRSTHPGGSETECSGTNIVTRQWTKSVINSAQRAYNKNVRSN
jgi:hypothetical protein